MLTVQYKDPETEAQLYEEYAFNLGQIHGPSRNVGKGRMVMRWVDGLTLVGARTASRRSGGGAGSWIDKEGYRLCQKTRNELVELGTGLPEADTAPELPPGELPPPPGYEEEERSDMQRLIESNQ